jgi:hypothetical protein
MPESKSHRRIGRRDYLEMLGKLPQGYGTVLVALIVRILCSLLVPPIRLKFQDFQKHVTVIAHL